MISFVLFSLFDFATFTTPLINAVRSGFAEEVRELINKNVDLNERSEDMFSAVTHAVLEGNAEILNLLIEARSDLNQYDAIGRTPLIWAVTENNLQFVRTLVAAKADINSKTEPGKNSAVYVDLENGELQVISFTGSNRADGTANDSFTALTFSILLSKFDMMEYLIFMGADLTETLSRNFREPERNRLNQAVAKMEARTVFLTVFEYVKSFGDGTVFDVVKATIEAEKF